MESSPIGLSTISLEELCGYYFLQFFAMWRIAKQGPIKKSTNVVIECNIDKHVSRDWVMFCHFEIYIFLLFFFLPFHLFLQEAGWQEGGVGYYDYGRRWFPRESLFFLTVGTGCAMWHFTYRLDHCHLSKNIIQYSTVRCRRTVCRRTARLEFHLKNHDPRLEKLVIAILDIWKTTLFYEGESVVYDGFKYVWPVKG